MADVKCNGVVIVVSHDDVGANLAFKFGSTFEIRLDSSLDPCMGSDEVFGLRFGILEDLHIEYAIHVVFRYIFHGFLRLFYFRSAMQFS